jgi:Flp pilus assembly protein TadG
MPAWTVPVHSRRDTPRRRGAAAAEFAVCLPLVLLMMAGLWEVGRMVEVEQIMWNGSREAARDASLGQDSLLTVASNLLVYLQGADSTAFPTGHSTSLIAPVVSLPANASGYTCWDNTANKELFTISFTDLTAPGVTDPTAMSQLDRYQFVVQVPYRSVAWSPLAQITATTRLMVTMTWASMVDAPFQIAPDLPAQ